MGDSGGRGAGRLRRPAAPWPGAGIWRVDQLSRHSPRWAAPGAAVAGGAARPTRSPAVGGPERPALPFGAQVRACEAGVADTALGVLGALVIPTSCMQGVGVAAGGVTASALWTILWPSILLLTRDSHDPLHPGWSGTCWRGWRRACMPELLPSLPC